MIFEMLQAFEDQPLRLAHGVATRERLLRIDTFQVNAFHVIPHLRNAAKAPHPFLVALRFVANADGALGLGEDEREWLEIGRFLLYQRSGRERDLESVPSRHFAAVAEREHETGGVDPALDNVLRGDTRNTCTDEFS